LVISLCIVHPEILATHIDFDILVDRRISRCSLHFPLNFPLIVLFYLGTVIKKNDLTNHLINYNFSFSILSYTYTNLFFSKDVTWLGNRTTISTIPKMSIQIRLLKNNSILQIEPSKKNRGSTYWLNKQEQSFHASNFNSREPVELSVPNQTAWGRHAARVTQWLQHLDSTVRAYYTLVRFSCCISKASLVNNSYDYGFSSKDHEQLNGRGPGTLFARVFRCPIRSHRCMKEIASKFPAAS
jgi:hypothetical protein